MQWRHELKFVVDDFVIERMHARLRPVLQADRHGARAGYDVRSLYFDDIYDSALLDKEGGEDIREKFRMRIYNGDGDRVYLEKKSKRGMYTQKARATLSGEQARALIEGRGGFPFESDSALVREFSIKRLTRGLAPRQIVDYNRKAFLCALGNVRITLDTHLSAPLGLDLFDESLQRIAALPSGEQILEIKYDQYLPEHIGQLLQIDIGRPQASSKYILCRLAAKR